MADPPVPPKDFIREAIAEDLRAGRFARVVTRFPPEPNAYLHIGHAKAIWTSYGIARDFGGEFHLRFDDTNPMKEEQEFIDAIIEDVRWLGCDWGPHLYYASDYFEPMVGWAVELIEKGKAYVCDLSAEEVREYRGTLTRPGRASPYRDRSVGENLDLFRRMRAGEFPDGARTLRARIDMASPNLNLRDPVMYRILHAAHPHVGEAWCLYPTYDWAHGLEDAIEGITHSLCSIEFENHRPLYDWFIGAINDGRARPIHHPRQIEFARYNLTHTVMSKRMLRELVEGGLVRGWDDPRLPTLRGLRRRGYVPEAVRDFSRHTGVSKYPATFDIALVEHFLRQNLNRTSPRVMAVLRPLKVVIENWPEGRTDQLDAINNPEDPSAGTRKVPFSRDLWIERDDFLEEPPKKFFRLAPGREVRLRYAYFVTCTGLVKDPATGDVVEVRCRYDPATRGGDAPDGRKVKATLHWVSAPHALAAEVRLYDHLFLKEDPLDVPEGADWKAGLNPNSLEVIYPAYVEPSLASARAGDRFQFERLGYFAADPDSATGRPVFNRTVTLKDTWARVQKRENV
jgi:glutaminyl-tRNA synthetase